jgi:hypothetical protein
MHSWGRLVNKTLELVLKECFWEDYKISIEEAEKLLNTKNKEFIDYLIIRIINYSPFPSSRLNILIDPDYLKEFLDKQTNMPPFLSKRIRLVKSVLYREPKEGIIPWKIN